jgi:hypothetical protein
LTSEKDEKMSQLEKEGWEKKFTIEEHRVEEYIELYESLDQEVRVESVVPGEMEGCVECFKADCDKYQVIYTRLKKATEERQ